MTREEAVQEAIEELGYSFEDEPMEHVAVELCDGHSGRGWYGWSAEYPDEGSVFLGTEEAMTAREMTNERLAEIRRNSAAHPGDASTRDLLAHVDALTAENARLRTIEEAAKRFCHARTPGYFDAIEEFDSEEALRALVRGGE